MIEGRLRPATKSALLGVPPAPSSEGDPPGDYERSIEGIARRLDRPNHTVSGQIRKLCEHGYLERREEHARWMTAPRMTYYLTIKGREAVAKLTEGGP